MDKLQWQLQSKHNFCIRYNAYGNYTKIAAILQRHRCVNSVPINHLFGSLHFKRAILIFGLYIIYNVGLCIWKSHLGLRSETANNDRHFFLYITAENSNKIFHYQMLISYLVFNKSAIHCLVKNASIYPCNLELVIIVAFRCLKTLELQ